MEKRASDSADPAAVRATVLCRQTNLSMNVSTQNVKSKDVGRMSLFNATRDTRLHAPGAACDEHQGICIT